MGPFLKDIAYSARALRKNASFTLVAVLTIGLGIGASTAIFSVVNAVLLRPLPYTDAERLVLVWGDLRARDVFDFPFPPADFADLREQGDAVRAVRGGARPSAPRFPATTGSRSRSALRA